jgi:hypothetical protein
MSDRMSERDFVGSTFHRSAAQPSEGAEPNAFEGWAEFEAEYPPAPCRSIEITPEILAEDAAKQAARDIPIEAWPIKAQLSEDNLRTVKRKQQPGRQAEERRFVVAGPKVDRRALRRKPRKYCACGKELSLQAKGDTCASCLRTGRAAAAKQVHQEEQPMKQHTEVAAKHCIVKGCDNSLTVKNTSGRCSKHWYLKAGAELKDGTTFSGMSAAKTAKPKRGRPSKGTLAKAGNPLPPPTYEARTTADGEGVVMLPVPVPFLDAFLSRLLVEDKVRIVASELQRGAAAQQGKV